ncbi:MAG: hypothetical protein GY757_19385 [bacterium]|nr:hypothetical protein [bacterium]
MRKISGWFIKTFLKGKEILPETFVHASNNLMIYKRNAILAAGNIGDASMLDAVKPFLDDPYLGKYARWTVNKLEQNNASTKSN